jgi:transglutaminase-like putative cysteine protease
MRFQFTHKLMTYLLALAALATLCAANLISAGVALMAIAMGSLSWFVDPETRLFVWVRRATPAFRIGATLFFAFTAYRVWRRLPDPDLTPILNLVVFLTVYKLFHRAANRDYLQISVLGFLMVVAGAAFAQSFIFVPAFVIYVVLTTWTLVLLHLRREMEENYLVKHTDQAPSHKVGVARVLNSRRVIGAPFLVATGGVALAVIVGAALTFALVPRVGSGFAFGGQRARRTLIGFSDEVTLGTAGFLSEDNDTVALRAVLPRLEHATSDHQREDQLDRLYWRGTVYDRYAQGRWLRSRSDALRTHIVEAVGGPSLIREPHLGPRDDASPTLAGTERQVIDIVGVSTPVAFALDYPVAFELPPTKFGTLTELRLLARWSGEVAFHSTVGEGDPGEGPAELRTFAGAHYIAYSRDPQSLTRALNGRPMSLIPTEVLAAYLDVPPALAGPLTALARTITAGRTTSIAKVIAITSWLEATHEYSTNLDRGAADERDPVDDFLFGRKSGHCEYFASAAALLLRSVGVPTRYVNGFLGGEWNAVGHHVTVRQNRAHAWVEAYLGELGWMRVDATPPVRPGARMGRLRQLLDSVDFLWGRWVVGYDLSRQIDIARDFGRGLGFGRGGHEKSPGEGGAARSLPPRPLAIGFGIVATSVGAWWLQSRRRRQRTAPSTPAALARTAIGRLYRRCVERLARGGHARRPAETPREFARRIEAEQPLAGTADFRQVTELYIETRFGQQVIAGDVVTGLARRLGQLGWFDHVAGRKRRAA